MTPEPIVATVRFERGDISGIIGAAISDGHPNRAIFGEPLPVGARGPETPRATSRMNRASTDESRSPRGGATGSGDRLALEEGGKTNLGPDV
jgi:hypothetical protein